MGIIINLLLLLGTTASFGTGIHPGLLPELVELSVGDTRNLTCPLQNKTEVKWCLVTSDSISRIESGVSIDVVGNPDCSSTIVQPPVPVCDHSLIYCTDQNIDMYHCTDDILPTKSYYFVNSTSCPKLVCNADCPMTTYSPAPTYPTTDCTNLTNTTCPDVVRDICCTAGHSFLTTPTMTVSFVVAVAMVTTGAN